MIKAQPAFGPAWNNLALAYFEKGEFAKAKDAAEQAQKCGYEVHPDFIKELQEKI